jgi:hypothetical protein
MNEAASGRQATRSCKKLIRFTPAELEVVNSRARAVGQPVACYIRDVSLGARKRAAASAPRNQEIIHQLSRVATRLCSLRNVATANGLAEAAEFGAAVDDLLEVIRGVE